MEKSMDWLLKGELYNDHNKFHGCADIHDYVVGKFSDSDVYSLIKYRKVKAPWKVAAYLQPVTLIAIAINRVIREYAPDTHLHNVSAAVTLTIGGIWFVIVCITGYINKKRS